MTKIAPAAKNHVSAVNARVVVLGSYAKRAVLTWRAMGASIAPSRVGSKTMYRVVTAPVSGGNYVSELRRIRTAGTKMAWALPLCDGGASGVSCVVLPARAIE